MCGQECELLIVSSPDRNMGKRLRVDDEASRLHIDDEAEQWIDFKRQTWEFSITSNVRAAKTVDECVCVCVCVCVCADKHRHARRHRQLK